MAYRFDPPLFDAGNGIDPADGAELFFFDFQTSNPKVTYADFALLVPNTDPVVADSNGLFGDIFLDIRASVTLRDRNGVLIYGAKDIYPPEDAISALAASLVSVLDTAGNFTAINVETVLAEIATGWSRLDRAETASGTKTFAGANIEMADNVIGGALLRDYAISHNVITSAAGVLTVDLEDGNSFGVTLSENITSMVIQNPPVTGRKGQFTLTITQDNAGGAYTLAQPASIVSPGGTLPVVTTSNGAIDDFTYRTDDGGTTWLIDFSQAYS